jgi:putative ABC transport system substrate-binding protein
MPERHIARRTIVSWLCAAAVAPVASRAQQAAIPAVGFLRDTSFATAGHLVAAFREGLGETGFADGRNVEIVFASARDRGISLPELAAGLVRRPVSVLVGNTPAAHAAKAATSTVPVVFTTGSDPVRDGLVASLNRPGGNVTGIAFFGGALGAKRLELLRQLVPEATTIAVLMYASNPEADAERRDVQAAAQALGQRLVMADAAREQDIEPAFASFVAGSARALLVGSAPLFTANRARIARLAEQHRLPAIYPLRDAVADGGLMSYGSSNTEAYRQAGIYAGRILKGEAPADLPVMRSTRFEFVLNLKTASALGLTVPPMLLALTDEVIE